MLEEGTQSKADIVNIIFSGTWSVKEINTININYGFFYKSTQLTNTSQHKYFYAQWKIQDSAKLCKLPWSQIIVNRMKIQAPYI